MAEALCYQIEDVLGSDGESDTMEAEAAGMLAINELSRGPT